MDELELMDLFPQFMSVEAGRAADTGAAPAQERGRLREIAALRLTEPDVEPILGDLCREASNALRLPSGCVSIVLDEAPHVAARHDVAQHSPLGTQDDLRGHPGIPLVTSRGFAVGSFCLAGPTSHTFSETDLQTLRRFAAEAVRRLETRRVEPAP